MIINHLDKLFVTSDATTMTKEMEIVHPAARMLVMAADQQEKEVGDAANFVLVFGGELNEFAKRMAYLVMVLGVLLGVAKLVSGLGLSAAVIASNALPLVV